MVRALSQGFAASARVIRGAARDPLVRIAGPSLTEPTSPWISGPGAGNFLRFVNGSARPNPITLHTYPVRGSAHSPGRLCASISDLLLDRSSHGLAQHLAPFVRELGDRRVLRVDEMNSVTMGGVAGVSDTFACALWALDTLFEYLRAGVHAVNFHTFNGARYQLYSGPRPAGWLVFPEYYGLLAFVRAAPAGARLLAVHHAPAARSTPAVNVWATRAPGGKLTIVVINESLRLHEVVLRGSRVPVKATAGVAWLRAGASSATPQCPLAYAANGLCVTGGVTLGGAGFGPPEKGILGGDRTKTGSLGTPRSPACVQLVRCSHQPPGPDIVLAVPAGSAALLTGWASVSAGATRGGAK